MWRFLAGLLGLEDSQPVEPVRRQAVRPPAARPAAATVNLERRRRYIIAHAYAIAERFSQDGGEGIRLDEESYNWLVIPKYPMPERWRQRWTSLMIMFPEGYPDVPPTGFYLTIRARLKSGEHDKHLFKGGGYYANAPDLSAQGWFWYCVHAQVEGSGGWEPSSDPGKPDNLFTFLNMVREALTTDV